MSSQDARHSATTFGSGSSTLKRERPSNQRILSHNRFLRVVCWLLIGSFVVSLILAQPAAAQTENPVCADESGTLPDMIEGFIQLTTAFGLIGLIVVWQADELAEMIAFESERRQRFKNHKLTATKSAGVLVVLGPLFTIAGTVMELPIAQCVDLVPF